MAGYGNPMGFTTQFGRSPLAEKLTGYEDIFPEQLGMPQAANIKQPEIENFSKAFAESNQFEDLMAKRKELVDLATQASSVGLNINAPRTQEEMEYAMLFNQKANEYKTLGMQLEQEQEAAKQWMQKAQQANVIGVRPERFTTSSLVEDFATLPSYETVRNIAKQQGFSTEEGAKIYNETVDAMAQELQVPPSYLEGRPELMQRYQQEMEARANMLGRGFVDKDKAEKAKLEQFKAQTSRISATRPPKDDTPIEPIVPYDDFAVLLNSGNINDVKIAFDYIAETAGLNKANAKQLDGSFATVDLPYYEVLTINGKPTAAISVADRETLNKLKKQEYTVRNGKLYDTVKGQFLETIPYRYTPISEMRNSATAVAASFKKLGATPLGQTRISQKEQGKEADELREKNQSAPTNPTKKQIKESDIATKAQQSGYSVEEYRKLLIQNGIQIVK